MRVRGIPDEAIDLALDWGRAVYTRGAVVYAIGRREVARCRAADLSRFEGVQVVCAVDDGQVLTVYRNRDFRTLRPKLGRRFSPPPPRAA
jgi:hypothetical protein